MCFRYKQCYKYCVKTTNCRKKEKQPSCSQQGDQHICYLDCNEYEKELCENYCPSNQGLHICREPFRKEDPRNSREGHSNYKHECEDECDYCPGHHRFVQLEAIIPND